MHLLIAISNRDCTKLVNTLQAYLPGVEISLWPDCRNLHTVEFVVAWLAPEQMWQQLPNLKAVSSFGAGVDSIKLDLLADDVVVTRIVDEVLADDMAEYVLTHILAQKLKLKEYFSKQRAQLWQPKRAHKFNHVVFLGFGQLGQHCAKRLLANNFVVSAFSQSPKQFTNVTCVHTQEGLTNILSKADYLVCLLPLTPQTKNIIDKAFLTQLPEHAVVINVARGQHIVEEDLIWALDNKVIRAATLDVFRQEPLAKEHPFWSHDAITVTPHCAALSSITSVAQQIAENVQRLGKRLELNHQVDRTKGY